MVMEEGVEVVQVVPLVMAAEVEEPGAEEEARREEVQVVILEEVLLLQHSAV
jgi:hypothetical protein